PWRLDGTRYPPAEITRLAFQDEPLALYTGSVELAARLAAPDAGTRVASLRLTVQACDDSACLRPEVIEMRVPLAPILRSAGEAY
ncbi:MAG: hypothetical protein VYE73_18355, partial [Acidobacteriota bacterium]|nr:hypothetical protein [Acidobacteriota bacterium]